jgi:CRISPR-associated protein Cas2
MSYDVRDPKRLRRVAKTLEGYGERIQYSVFRVRATSAKLEKLKWQLSEILESEDNLLVIPLCDGCAAKVDEHSRGNCTDWGDPPPTFELM